jgi:hypothetical protein
MALLMTMGLGALVIVSAILWFLTWMMQAHTLIIAVIYAFMLGAGTVFLRYHFFDDEDE